MCIVGDEGVVPVYGVDVGGGEFYTDYFYGCHASDGLPDVPVARVLGAAGAMARQLADPASYAVSCAEPRALFMCSEDTRLHLESRTFLLRLQELGYASTFTIDEADELLPAYDAIIHFGHGNDSALSGRWQTYVTADAIPPLPRGPIAFVDGCATTPPGSPLLRSFLNRGGLAYFGSSSSVAGMIPARYACELIVHFLRRLGERPDTPIAELLRLARVDYLRAHSHLGPLLQGILRDGRPDTADPATDVATVLQWHLFGAPFASFSGGSSEPAFHAHGPLADDVALDPGGELGLSVPPTPVGHVPVLALRARWPAEITLDVRIIVRQDGYALHEVRGDEWTIYQHVADTCVGGYSDGSIYHAYCMLPLFRADRGGELTLSLTAPGPVTITAETAIDIWPEERSGRYVNLLEWEAGPAKASDGERVSVVSGPQMDRARRPKPIRVAGSPTKSVEGGYALLGLDELYTRPHDSMRVGGADNASFATWFATDRVEHAGVPFRVATSGHDVLVSPTNAGNQWTLHHLCVCAYRVHMLVFGYNLPDSPLSLRLLFEGGSTASPAFGVYEWSETQPGGDPAADAQRLTGDVAFDFESTVDFPAAAITHASIDVPEAPRAIQEIACGGGSFGLVAVTIQTDRARQT